jgi:signal peptidase I
MTFMNQEPPTSLPPARAPDNDRGGRHLKIGSGITRTLTSLVLFLIIPVGIALFLTAFIIQSYQVDGQSMETTLQDHDRLIVNKLPRTLARVTGHGFVPHRGDIIVFNQSGLPDIYYQKQLIKRVIGLPGDRVVVDNGHITIYNWAHPQGFNPDLSAGYHIAAPSTEGNIDVALQTGEIFVCGDNRGNSEDSRYFGPVNVNTIVGKLVVRILPINNTQVF